jgi:hypothetical protein
MNNANVAQVAIFAAGMKPSFQGWGQKFSSGSPGQRSPWFAESCDEMVGYVRCFASQNTFDSLKTVRRMAI